MSLQILSVGLACTRGIGNENILSGTNPTQFTRSRLPQFSSKIVGLVPDFDAALYLTQKKSLKLMSRASLLAVVAARTALKNITALSSQDAGLFLAVGMSGGEITNLAGLLEESLTPEGALDLVAMGKRGLSRLNPLLSFHVLNNMPLCHTSIELGFQGPHGACYATTPEDGLQVFLRAVRAVKHQEAPWVLVGGADAPVSTIALSLSQNQTTPAEGAALLAITEKEPQTGDIEIVDMSICVTAPKNLFRETSEYISLSSRPLPNTLPIIDLIGDTSAATAAFGLAAAVARLRALPLGSMIAVVDGLFEEELFSGSFVILRSSL